MKAHVITSSRMKHDRKLFKHAAASLKHKVTLERVLICSSIISLIISPLKHRNFHIPYYVFTATFAQGNNYF